MSSTESFHNQTEFGGPTSGVYSTGSGDVNLFVANLGEAIEAIKKLIPDAQTNALEKLIAALKQLTYYQKQVQELKKVHNMLHNLESQLSMLEAVICMQEGTMWLEAIESAWRRVVRPQIHSIRYFAEHELSFLNTQPLTILEEKIVGPFWIINLIALQKDFEISMKERDTKSLTEIARNLLDTTRDNLFRIDRQLLEAINQLDKFSEQILRIISNE